ncbi:hypothetical protein GCM10011384_12560 [Psychrobacillus lasiicapitis]|nr:hypothetical protein GCM10011384_12560 [Psychrobacillus lasiicapitis]
MHYYNLDYTTKGVLQLKQHFSKKLIVDIIFILIQTACIVGLIITDNYDYMRMSISNLLFWLVYIFLEFKLKWSIPLYIRIAVTISIISNDVLGELINLYVTSFLFDRIQHIFGTYSLTLWSFFIIQQFVQMKFIQKKLIIIFFITLSTTLGTFYEIFEFLQDELFKPVIKNQTSLLDTDLDLISDVVGGIIALIHYLSSESLRLFRLPFEQKCKS